MLMKRFQKNMFRGAAQRQLRYVTPVSFQDATGLVRQTYDQMERFVGLAPPVSLHSPVPEVLAGVWAIDRESYFVSRASRAHREAVASAVSRINECPYCVDAHSMVAATVDRSLGRALRRGRPSEITDRGTAGVFKWASSTLSPGAAILRVAPLPPEVAVDLLGTALAYHYTNRVVNIFLRGESPLMLPRAMRWSESMMRWMMIRLMPTSMFDTDEGPGDSLSLLPDAPLPSEFQWAAARPEIAGAFARFIAVCTAAGKETLSEPVCELTEAYVGGWNGEDPGLGRRWLADAVSELTPSDRTAARIALLTAIASYQIAGSSDKLFQRFTLVRPSTNVQM